MAWSRSSWAWLSCSRMQGIEESLGRTEAYHRLWENAEACRKAREEMEQEEQKRQAQEKREHQAFLYSLHGPDKTVFRLFVLLFLKQIGGQGSQRRTVMSVPDAMSLEQANGLLKTVRGRCPLPHRC